MRAVRATFRDPVQAGAQGRPRVRPWRNLGIAPVVKRYAQRCVVAVARRIVDGPPARVETLRRRSQGDGVINTAYSERLHATFRERLASLTRRGRALARHTLTLRHGMDLMGTLYNFGTPHASLRDAQSCGRGGRCGEDACHGRRDHASWLDHPGAVVVSCAAVSLDATQAARAAIGCIATPH